MVQLAIRPALSLLEDVGQNLGLVFSIKFDIVAGEPQAPGDLRDVLHIRALSNLYVWRNSHIESRIIPRAIFNSC